MSARATYRTPLRPGLVPLRRLAARVIMPPSRHRYRCRACGRRHGANRCPLLCRLCGARLMRSRDLAVLTCHSPACVRAMHAALRAEAAA